MIRMRMTLLGICLISPVHAQMAGPAGTNWLTYTDPDGRYEINYPSDWQTLTKGNALVITSPGGPEERGVFGITLRAAGLTVDAAVDKEFQDPEHPADLKKSPARIGEMPATKVWGSKKGDPNIREVKYYVQNGPQQYYILFQAPHAAMDHYRAVFNAMIASMKFLK
jgi:hypothetical protein